MLVTDTSGIRKSSIASQPRQNELNFINFATKTPNVRANIAFKFPTQISKRQDSSTYLQNSSTAAMTSMAKGNKSSVNNNYLNI